MLDGTTPAGAVTIDKAATADPRAEFGKRCTEAAVGLEGRDGGSDKEERAELGPKEATAAAGGSIVEDGPSSENDAALAARAFSLLPSCSSLARPTLLACSPPLSITPPSPVVCPLSSASAASRGAASLLPLQPSHGAAAGVRTSAPGALCAAWGPSKALSAHIAASRAASGSSEEAGSAAGAAVVSSEVNRAADAAADASGKAPCGRGGHTSRRARKVKEITYSRAFPHKHACVDCCVVNRGDLSHVSPCLGD